jgi:exopolysaccharide production protein ExoZ
MIRSIQILRGLAALFVVFAHFEFLNIKIGGFGVDIFFIISGFIIGYMVNKDTESFLYRRLLRIVPLYVFMTTLTTVISIIKPSWFRNVYVSGITFVKSILFIPYRIGKSGPILSLGWTLNYEMFFYLITALCIAMFRKEIVVKMSFLVIIGFVLLNKIFPAKNYIIKFLGADLILEFVLGGLLYYFWRNYHSKLGSVMKNLLVIIGMLSFAFMIYADLYLDIHRLLRFGIPAMLLANAWLLLEDKFHNNSKLVEVGMLLGDASYAMYLVHPFVIYAFIRVLFKGVNENNLPLYSLELILAMGAVCVVSVLLHKKFEKPVIRLLRSALDQYFLADRKHAVKSNLN